MKIAVHCWNQPGLGSVNTFWIETEDAVIVIDGQRELSKARRVLAEIEATGKPIAAVFLTHPHPDHFGGIGVFAPAGTAVPLYASRQTHDSIAEDRFGLVKASHEVVGDDFPEQVRLPDQFIEDGDELTIAGLRMTVHELGEGEAECMTALYLPDHRLLFCADIIQDRMTAFLLEGRSGAWLAQLDRLRVIFPDTVTIYPGHGAPGTPDALIARQAAYLRDFRALVTENATDGEADDAAARVANAMEARYPAYQPVAAIPDLLTQNVGPVREELASEA